MAYKQQTNGKETGKDRKYESESIGQEAGKSGEANGRDWHRQMNNDRNR